MKPNEATKELRPSDLAEQLFDASILQNRGNPREAARQVIVFLTESLIYAITTTAGDDTARKALLKSTGDLIAAAQPLNAAPSTGPAKP